MDATATTGHRSQSSGPGLLPTETLLEKLSRIESRIKKIEKASNQDALVNTLSDIEYRMKKIEKKEKKWRAGNSIAPAASNENLVSSYIIYIQLLHNYIHLQLSVYK